MAFVGTFASYHSHLGVSREITNCTVSMPNFEDRYLLC